MKWKVRKVEVKIKGKVESRWKQQKTCNLMCSITFLVVTKSEFPLIVKGIMDTKMSRLCTKELAWRFANAY